MQEIGKQHNLGSFIIGNWKMNGNKSFITNFLTQLSDHLSLSLNTKLNSPDTTPSLSQNTDHLHNLSSADALADALYCNNHIMLAPPVVYLDFMAKMLEEKSLSHIIKLTAQDCFYTKNGAYTRAISAEMLKDFGVKFCILGHSERRTIFGESEQSLAKKIEAVLAEDIAIIYCIGENKQQYQAGITEEVLGQQLQNLHPYLPQIASGKIIIAYEPVWAIGTGLVPKIAEIAKINDFIRKSVNYDGATDVSNISNNGANGDDDVFNNRASVIYGGSVNSANATSIINEAKSNGLLIGGASLKPEEFCKIISYNL